MDIFAVPYTFRAAQNRELWSAIPRAALDPNGLKPIDYHFTCTNIGFFPDS